MNDSTSDVGGFQCVPELFRNFNQWFAHQPQGRDPFHPDLTGLEVKFVPMQPGELLIFNTLLAHGIKPNQTKDRVRMAQYTSMYPAEGENVQKRETRDSVVDRTRASVRLRLPRATLANGRRYDIGRRS